MHAALPLDLPGPGDHRVVVDDAPTRDLLETMAVVFGMPGSLVDLVAQVQALPGVRAEINVRVVEGDRVVGVAQGYPHAGTVLLGNIATPEDARGRGIGTVATATVLRVAQERGLGDAVLVSSAAGHGVYERLGFTDVCTTTTWTWLPPDAGR